MATEQPPWRLFLDTGVIIAGVTQPWGASNAVLILVTDRQRYRVVLAEAVREEVDDVLITLARDLPADAYERTVRHCQGWFQRVRLERWPHPPAEMVAAATDLLLPAVRHINDLPIVVTAMQARPDWVISTNTAHWNSEVARRTELRIVTPNEFSSLLTPRSPAREH